MFPSSGIRKLARSEEMFAETHNFVGLAAHVAGPVDADALSDAFDLLLQAHPVLGGHLEQGPDGKWEIVLDDLMHDGIEVVELTGDAPAPPLLFDQTAALVHLRLTIRDGEAQPTLYIHHSMADGHHQFSLIEELFGTYTDLVTTGSAKPVTVHSAPEPLEVILANRGVEKKTRSGLERLLAAMFVYDLPPSRRAPSNVNPVLPQRVPMEYCTLSEEDTESIIGFCRANKLGLNSLLSAAVLMAEWQLRKTPNIPVPYVYPVDLRYLLSPPVSATESTNPVGIATYLAEISQGTDVAASRPRYQRHVQEGHRRRGDPAELPAFQPAVRRQPAGPPGRRDVHRQRHRAADAYPTGDEIHRQPW